MFFGIEYSPPCITPSCLHEKWKNFIFFHLGVIVIVLVNDKVILFNMFVRTFHHNMFVFIPRNIFEHIAFVAFSSSNIAFKLKKKIRFQFRKNQVSTPKKKIRHQLRKIRLQHRKNHFSTPEKIQF